MRIACHVYFTLFIHKSICFSWSRVQYFPNVIIILSTCLQFFWSILNVCLCQNTNNLYRYTLYSSHNMTITKALVVFLYRQSIRCIDTTKRFLLWTNSTRTEHERSNHTALVLGKKKRYRDIFPWPTPSTQAQASTKHKGKQDKWRVKGKNRYVIKVMNSHREGGQVLDSVTRL